ncbi:hexosyltransferase : Hexosyltransferase OS=uncultured planctomycete GN=HGMM_F11G08C15 PE=4 SV=1: Glyco_trans_4_4: Glycos_transf_1 [Gemmataceae bacterium]|jgi:glycosyltransferase involved in cell wall biosynthesis|nr:hexosyltransferase : Hexosyltransferase OS=uncultured planctomycete GN=HGMM_F11G08C15 PE=4 SV=1: Glyco_trans_4_4: Glycos_transf_1 [Gemmataceae bacterium]VTT98717.1 hexosyltransferase : Hexosyltransferase OS=uncultured planctomycete GN=HGMM_F11G08C15 PE=4 SV=1: Glyco_trans_4_4: Glycos_transf_1 [Gemmataceae bacterium]
MRIAYITAGAAGMYCGSCMRDNTLVAALGKAGHDALLIPTYTPIRTDEVDVSQDRVFFGGINVYLEQKFWLFRHTPRLLDRLFNFRWLLRWVSRFAVRTKYSELGGLTISMLQGTHGNQLKEVTKLADWLESDVKPEVVVLTNALLSGVAPELRRRLGVPIVVTFQGDDIFLDALPLPDREKCFALIRENCVGAAAFITTSREYADHMAGYLGLPREKMHTVYPGLNLNGHGGPRPVTRDRPLTIGYFARICAEKGFHNLVDAYVHLRQQPGAPRTRLRASGWLGENNQAFFDAQLKKLEAAGLLDEFEYVECPGHDDKVKFLRSIDVFSVPTSYREPKGLYVLEAWANGVPVVQPRHGSFPELVEATGGGILVEPEDPAALAAGLRQMLDDHDLRDRRGRAGEAAVRERFTAAAMAAATAALLDQIVKDAHR